MSVLLKIILVLMALYYVAKFALRLMFAPFIKMQQQMMEDVQRQRESGFYGPQNAAKQESPQEGEVKIRTLKEENKESNFGSDDDEYIEYEELNGDN